MSSVNSNSIQRSKNPVKSMINCAEFSQSQIPNLKEMDHYMFVEYNGQGHMHPQRVASARSRNVASVKLTYFSSDHLSYLNSSSGNLNMLDLSGSDLFKIPPELISGMINLQIIILNNNQLSDNSFCKEFAIILGKTLKEINLCHNRLTCLFSNMDCFVKLLRLKISNNALTTLKNIEKLKRIKLLMVENNDITQLGSGFYQAKRLENVYLSHNKLSSLAPSIKNLIHLRELDLSNNVIKVIPSDLFLLPQLEILMLNNNKINQIPKFKITIRLNNPISFVDLSCNSIVRFPDCLMRITQELDLTNNKIKTVPSSVLKKIPYKTTQKVHLNNNPISDPPKEICDSGLKAMIQHYEEFEGTEAKYYGIKIFCFGNNSKLKNQIVNFLSDQSECDDFHDDVVDILEISDTNSKIADSKRSETDSFNIKILNMSTDSHYIDFLNLFLTSQSFNLIIIDVDNWSDDKFGTSVEFFIKNILSKHNDIIFSVVCVTKHDKSETLQIKCDHMKSKVRDFLENYMSSISDEIQKIESQEKITPSMSQTLKKFIQLKSLKFNVENNVVAVNVNESKTMKLLANKIRKIMTNKTIYPNVGILVPSFWADVQTYFEDESYQFPIMSFAEFENLLQLKFNLKSVVKTVGKYLHEVGCVLWWMEGLAPLNQWVVTSPQTLIDCCRLLFQSDLKSYLEDPNDPNSNLKRFKKRFPNSRLGYRRCCEILLHEAVLLPELSGVLFEHILPSEYIAKMMFYLCRCWNLGYIVEYEGCYCQDWSMVERNDFVKDNASDITSSVTSQEHRIKSADSRVTMESRRSQEFKSGRIPPLYFTFLSKKQECSPEVLQKWQIKNNLQIKICYRFPVGCPKLIFQQATVRANDRPRFNVTLMDHWIGCFQGQIREKPILFRIENMITEDDHSIIHYDFVYRDSSVASDTEVSEAYRASEVWKSMLDILTDMDSLLNSYQGLWFERFVKCPHCEELSFPGTWHSYNDNDSRLEEECIKCAKMVPVYLLEPPKVSKNVSAEEVIRNIRKQFDRE